MRDSPLYTLVFSAGLGLVCAVLLSASDRWTRPYRLANEKAEKVRRVLEVLAVPLPPDADARTLVRLFRAGVTVERLGAAGAVRYVYRPPGTSQVEAVAIPFSGAGLWGPIRGLIALEADGVTVRGIVFTHQEETPGLGGEITASWFREQFRGKHIRDSRGRVGLRILRAGIRARTDTEVDGITGATLTCTKLQEMLNRALRRACGESVPGQRGRLGGSG